MFRVIITRIPSLDFEFLLFQINASDFDIVALRFFFSFIFFFHFGF